MTVALVVLVLMCVPPTAGHAMPDHLGEKIDRYLCRLAGFGYSGAVLVTKGGEVIIRKGYGMADRERHVPNTSETVFDIGSLSKQFTATAVLKLEALGKLKVSDQISAYLPSAPADKAAITIHQLLSHTSGLARGVWAPDDVRRADMVTAIFAQPLQSEPGTDFAYSNSGYVLLAAIVESASGEPFRDFLRRVLFVPAGMHDTGFWGNQLPSVNARYVACGYDALGKDGSPAKWSATTWRGLGATGVTSTVEDLLRWHLALQRGAILSPEALRRMWTAVQHGYAYGWNVEMSSRNGTMIWHGGDSDGFGAMFRWYTDQDVLIVSLSNVRHDLYPTHIKADEVIPKIVFGEPYESPPAFAGTVRAPEQLLGAYRLASGGEIVIEIESGQLQVGARGQDAVDVLREGDNKELELRASYTVATRRVLEAYVRGDMAPLAEVGGRDPDFQKSIGDEISRLGEGKGQLRSFDVLGTFPSGEPDVQNTLVQLNYSSGRAYYRLRWSGGAIEGTYTKATSLAAVTPIQPASANLFVGWNIGSWEPTTGFTVKVRRVGGRVKGLMIRRSGREWIALS